MMPAMPPECVGGRGKGWEGEKRLEAAIEYLGPSRKHLRIFLVLILIATLLGTYYYFLLEEGETEALSDVKVFAVFCIHDVSHMEGQSNCKA